MSNTEVCNDKFIRDFRADLMNKHPCGYDTGYSIIVARPSSQDEWEQLCLKILKVDPKKIWGGIEQEFKNRGYEFV